ncbi:MAG: hypothetical protein RLZZ52_323, partial [Actinomycetota bacterium]
MNNVDFEVRAANLDARDALSPCRNLFFGMDDDLPGAPLAYFDGNSLGRPLSASFDRIEKFLRHDWGVRLIRSWDEQ